MRALGVGVGDPQNGRFSRSNTTCRALNQLIIIRLPLAHGLVSGLHW